MPLVSWTDQSFAAGRVALAAPPRKGRGPRRRLLAALCLTWLIGGFVGTYSYLKNYYLHRGFPAPAIVAGARVGTLKTIHFHSTALHRRADYLIYLPGGYSRARRYPVLYLLHGVPGRPQAFTSILHVEIRMENLIRRGLMAPMVLVFPDGEINGSYFSDSEWANTRSGRFESYVLEVVRQVERHVSTIPSPRARVIAGYSEGGYAALNIALHHPGVFGAAEVWSGYFTQTRTGVFAPATRAQLAYNSPLDYASRSGLRRRRQALRVFMFGGRSDPTARQIPSMAQALRAAGALVHWAIYPGGHDWQLWNGHASQMLVLAGHDVGATGRFVAARKPIARAPLLRDGRSRSRGAGAPLALTGLLLALLSAAAINLGFLLQHRGLSRLGVRDRRALGFPRGVLRSPIWLGGQALGWIGFCVQILAVSIAPLSLVQAFAAGGLALSVPLAAVLFSHRISRIQLMSVLLVATALAVLPIGLGGQHGRLDTPWLTICVATEIGLAVVVCLVRRATLLGVAAGLFYGAADGGIKAVSVNWSAHGPAALLSPWAGLAVLGTLAGFLAFQSALDRTAPVGAISLMNALAALAGLLCGVVGFGEALGRDSVLAVHVGAIVLVLLCLPALAAAQTEMTDPATDAGPLPDSADAGPADGQDRGYERAGNQQEALQPGPQPRRMAPEHVVHPQVAGQHE